MNEATNVTDISYGLIPEANLLSRSQTRMAEDESKKISKDINKIEESSHFYKKELFEQRTEEGVSNARKSLTMAKVEESHLNFKLRKAKDKEGDTEKRKRDIDSSTHTD